MKMGRRSFVSLGALALAGRVPPAAAARPALKPITVASGACGFEREPMVRSFGFKGGYLTEECCAGHPEACGVMRAESGCSPHVLPAQPCCNKE